MTSEDFFHRMAAQYAMRLPFVAYSKPKTADVQVIFQNDTQLHEADDYSRTGFVFAPFHKEEKAYFIPGKSLMAEMKPTAVPERLPKASTVENSVKEIYTNLVEKAISKIKTSDLKKVVLSRKEVLDNDQHLIALFKKLLSTYPDAFTYVWFHPKVGIWLGSTPETLLEVSGLRFKTMALAGTQVDREEKEQVWGAKEVEEQQLVVEAIEEKLNRFQLKNFNKGKRKTVKAGNLLHLQTQITGLLNEESQLKNLIECLHPTPAVCGLPQDMAKNFITENEPYSREFYAGFLGEINQKEEQSRAKTRRNTENLAYKSIKNTSSIFVNLRCMQLVNDKVALYVGGGITVDSQPELEWEETVAKAQTMMRVLQRDK